MVFRGTERRRAWVVRMKRVEMTDIAPYINTWGRNYYDKDAGILYMNWSASGMEFKFMGSFLAAELTAMAGAEIEGDPWDQNAPTRPTWPWIQIFTDDEEEPVKIEIAGDRQTVLLYAGSSKEKHRIRLLKQTENYKTQLGICGFVMDGELFPLSKPQRKRIEFVGDSITCGFGNMTSEKDRMYFPADEDAYFSHAVMAARSLGMEWSLVSLSGICATANACLPNPYAMDELYSYTDRVIQDKLKAAELERWDFAAYPNDYVVINLGTNDDTGLSMAENPEEVRKNFCEGYRAFLETVRACNGADTYIVCALGCMRYYLYPEIEKIVAAYQVETGDRRISCFRYMGISPMDGLGACCHPSLVTQRKMAEEIVREIKRIEQG